MMRTLVLAGLSYAATSSHAPVATCGLNSVDAVDEMLDSAVFVWAAANRCGKPGESVKCEIDISSAVQSLNGMANVIVTTLKDCGKLAAAHNPECGMAVSEMTQSAAGLAAASGGLANSCTTLGQGGASQAVADDWKSAQESHGDATSHATHRRLNGGAQATTNSEQKIGTCVVDMKGSFKSLFEVVRSSMGVSQSCRHKHAECVTNSLDIVAAFAALGEYMSGTIGDCAPAAVINQESAGCASAVMALVHNLDDVALAGKKMSQFCVAKHMHLKGHFSEDTSLYNSKNGPVAPNDTIKYVAFALMAILPISSAMSFIAGKRTIRSRSQPVVREMESLVEVEEPQVIVTEDIEAADFEADAEMALVQAAEGGLGALDDVDIQ